MYHDCTLATHSRKLNSEIRLVGYGIARLKDNLYRLEWIIALDRSISNVLIDIVTHMSIKVLNNQ